MGRNLGPLNIKDTYEGLVQISSSLQLTDGSGSLIPSVDVTASNATAAQTIDIQSGAGDTDFTVPFFDPASGVGQNSLLGSNNLEFNPSTNTLTAGTFNGNLSGTATSASRATSAARADVADKVRTNVDTADAERYITYVENANGDYPINVDANLTFNPSTNNLTTDTFTGDLVGNADTAISASYATTASFALNVTSPDLQDVTDQGADTTNAITIDGYPTNTTQFRVQKSNVDKFRFQTTATNNSLLISSVLGETGRVRFTGDGDHIIRSAGDLTITTDSGKVIATDISASGYVSASEFIGDLTGNATTATTATSASHALNADNAISSSYAVTASFALNVTSPDLQDVTDQGNTTSNYISSSAGLIIGSGINPAAKIQVGDLEDGGVWFGGERDGVDQIRFTSTDSANQIYFNASGSQEMRIRFFGDGIVRATDELTLEGTSLLLDSPIVRLTAASASSYVSASEFIGPLTGNATTATSASHAIFADTAGTAADNNAMYTASISDANITFTKGDASTFAIEVNNVNNAVSASYATTASFALNAGASNLQEVINAGNIATGSAYLIGSLLVGNSGSAIPDTNRHNVHLAVNSGITNSGTYNAAIAANNATLGAGNANLVAGVENSHIYASSNSNMILGSRDSQITAGAGGNANAIVGAEFSQIQSGTGNTVIAGYSNNITAGGYNFIIAKEANTISSSGGYNAIIGTFGGTISSGRDQTIIGGIDGTISSGDNRNTIIGGDDNEITGGQNGVVIGGRANTNNAQDGAVIAGNDSTNNGSNGVVMAAESSTNNSGYCGIFAAHATTINNADTSVALGGYVNAVQGARTFVIGGQNNTMGTGTTHSGIVGGTQNNIQNNVTGSVIIGGKSQTATTSDTVYLPNVQYSGSFKMGTTNSISGTHGAAIATENSTIAHNNSVVIGGSGLSTDRADQVVVPNLKVSGSVNSHLINIPITSNTGSIDCNDSNFFTITLQNGVDTHLTATNLKAGQTINIEVNQNSTSPGTLSYNDAIFKFSNGNPFTPTLTTGAVDILTFTNFGGSTLYGTGLSNFS